MAANKGREPVVGGTPLSAWRQRLTAAVPEERRRAVNELADMGKRALNALPVLAAALSDGDDGVQAQVLRALVRLDVECPGTVGPAAEAALPALRRLLTDGSDSVRVDAARVLGSIGPAAAAAAPKIGNLLARSGNVDASWVADSLSKLGPAGVPPLVKALRSRRMNSRCSAAAGLGKLGPAAAGAVPDLVAALTNKPPVRSYAAMALGQIASNAKVAVPALIKVLDDEEHEARRAVMTSLGQFGPAARAAVPKLIPFLGPTDWSWWHFLAAEALGRIGPAASAALEPLQKLVNSKERRIREEAQNAIRLISGSPTTPEVAAQRKKPGPGDTMFDFLRTKQVVAQMIEEGVARFAAEHFDEEVACVALFSRGFSAFACLCIGTPEEVPADLKHGGAYDFKYSEYGHEDFEWWPDLYKVGTSFTIKLADGKVLRRSTDKNGNDAIDKPLLDLLIEVLTEALPLKGLKLANGFRVGVEMHDSKWVRFWRPK